MATDAVFIGHIDTALGAFGAAVGPHGLGRLTFPCAGLAPCLAWAERWWPGAAVIPDESRLAQAAQQLRAYLAGQLREFSLDLDLRGAPFELQAWRALQGIPFGQTRTYRQLAASIGRPRAARAVGRATAANQTPIVVPCHRVIGSDGALVGYGGGLDLKRHLLALEGIGRSC